MEFEQKFELDYYADVAKLFSSLQEGSVVTKQKLDQLVQVMSYYEAVTGLSSINTEEPTNYA